MLVDAGTRESAFRRPSSSVPAWTTYQCGAGTEESVEKSPGVLSLDAIKKAEQIEKLARSVKTKMKQSY